jgi:hypothetical protein
MTLPPIVGSTSGVVNGVDVDTIASAALGCAGVDDLIGGPPTGAATYLPGRRVNGVLVETQTVTIQMRSRWGHDIAHVAHEVQLAVAPHAGRRRVDVVIAELGDPTDARSTATVPQPLEEERWTNSTPGSAQRVGHSLAPIIPIAVATPTPLSPASPRSTGSPRPAQTVHPHSSWSSDAHRGDV